MDASYNNDMLRVLARRMLDGRLYRWGAALYNDCQVLRREGWRVWRDLQTERRDGALREIRLSCLAYPMVFRPGTPDVGAIVQNLIRFEYGRLPAGMEPELIIDAGGYIGDVSLFFLNRFSCARVITLEPESENYELARQNLAPYRHRVELLNAGLWSTPKTLRVAGSYTGASLESSCGGAGVEIPCTDLDTLLKRSGCHRIDILKLDIEGAEQDVLLNNSESWLPRTQAIIVEFHGSDIRDNCEAYLTRRGFSGYRYRSLHYFFNDRLG